MNLNESINIKKSCEVIVRNCDLTGVLASLRDRGYRRVVVRPFMDDSGWRVSIRTTSDYWYNDLEVLTKVAQFPILVPLKDTFGRTRYEEA